MPALDLMGRLEKTRLKSLECHKFVFEQIQNGIVNLFIINHHLGKSCMFFKRLSTKAAMLAALAVLSACGGSSSNADLTPEAAASSITSTLTAGLAALSSGIGIGSNVLGLFDENYLDGSDSRANVKANIDAFTSATATDPDLSMFPTAELTNSRVTDCNFNGVCTLTATLTNKDTDDITTVDFSTKVKVIGTSVFLYGDQSSTAL